MMALSAPIDLNYSKLNYTAMKHFNLLKTTLLLCALIVGSLSSWAEETTATLDMTKAQTSPVVVNGVTFSWTSSYIITGAASDASNGFGGKSGTADMTITIPEGKKLVGISKENGNNWGSTNINVYAGTDTKGSLVTEIKQSTNSYTISTNNTGSTYYLVTSAKKNAWIKSLTIQYDDASTSGKKSVDAPTFSPSDGAITAGSTISLTQASADEIRYTLDGTNPTKTTGTVYSGPIVITTAKTIKAIAVEGGDVSSVATAAYTIDVATPTFSLESGSYLVGSTFSMSASGNKIYYNLTTDGSEPAKPTTSSTEYTTPIVISGKTRIKAIAVDSYGNTSNVVTRTYTGIAPAVLPFSWTGTSSEGKAELGKITGVEVSLSSDYAASNAPYRLKFDAVGKNVIIYTDVKPYMVSFTAKLYNATSDGSKLTVQESVDGIEFTDVEDFVIDGLANSTFSFTSTNSFNANTRAVKLVMTEKDQNVGVGTIVVTKAEPITISSAGWATYSSNYPLDFTGVTALTAYTATKDDNVVKFNKVTGKVPANTGLLVRGETANVPVCASAEAVENLLVGVTTETVKDANTVCVLMKGSKGIGFYKNTNDFTLRANSAYLRAEDVEGSTARAFIALDDETTGIADVKAVKEDAEGMFDLQGRKIAKPTKGLYIVNGKKVVVK